MTRLLSSSATCVITMTGLLSPVALFHPGTIHVYAIGQAGPSIWSRIWRPKEGHMRRVSTVLTAIMCLLLVAALASRTPAASVPEVLIGDVLPLTGNFASLGQQYLWAGQTVEDIINNDYPDLAVPLGPGKGFPGLGGAPAKFIFRDDQRSEEHTSELQSHSDLVCRLLLEKKKNKKTQTTI